VLDRSVIVGSVIIIAGVVGAAYPNVLTKINESWYDPLVLTTISIGIAAVIHLIAATLFRQWASMVWDFKNLGAIFYLGFFGSALAFLIYYYLLKHMAVVKLSFVTFITPIFALLIGHFFLSEVITLKEILGICLIFVGLILYDVRMYLSFWKQYKMKRLVGDR
jgi:drug/metabolite transporter (DMT)-like permease